MKNSMFVLLLIVTCSFAVNLSTCLEEKITSTNSKGEGHLDCSHDGPHPKYYTIQEMLKFENDEEFKTTIQGFMDYFHSACHDYQVKYVRGRISELLKISEADNHAFFGRFVTLGFNPNDIDPRISSSIQKIMIDTAQKKEDVHTDCSKDRKAPKYFTFQETAEFRKNAKFLRKQRQFVNYFNRACHRYQVGYIIGRISELLKFSELEFNEFKKRFKKVGMKKTDIDDRIFKTYDEIMEITSKMIE